MKKRLIVKPEARSDIEESFAYYYDNAGVEVALRFVDAVDRSVRSILAMPARGAPRPWLSPTLSGFRSWPIDGFENHHAYYYVTTKTVEVVRVLHGARDVEALFDGGE